MNAHDLDAVAAVMADDFVDHEEIPGLEPTKEGALAFFRLTITAFPDVRFEAEDVLVDGDKVVARARFTGTHEGDFMGVPASGKRVDIALIDIIRFGDDGLAHDHWGVMDALALMQQVGAIPDGPPA
ncbi:MAG: ester cyclase [Candidatus Limnocylindrales bacterium]